MIVPCSEGFNSRRVLRARPALSRRIPSIAQETHSPRVKTLRTSVPKILYVLLGAEADGGRGFDHAATPLKDHTLVDAQAGGVDIPSENRRLMDFDPMAGPNTPMNLTTHDHYAGIDRGVHFGLFAYDERIGGINLSPKGAVDPDSSVKTKLSFKFAPLLKNAGNGVVCGSNAQVF